MKPICPLVKKPCLEHGCEFWTDLVVTLPSGETAAAWKCLYKWIPILLIESAKETRHAAASSDKVANEIRGAGGDIIRRALKLPGPDQLLEQK